jgi:hypothetical protein
VADLQGMLVNDRRSGAGAGYVSYGLNAVLPQVPPLLIVGKNEGVARPFIRGEVVYV